MDISQESDSKPQDEIPVLSSYAKNLESHVRVRYLKKISVVGVDPAAIPSEQFSSECLPPIEVADLLSYLVLETSYYTNKQFKAFKSLEAYNQMVSGFVASVQGKEIAGKIVVVAKHGSAVDAVEVAVRYMEDNPIFNAGHGSALTEENTVELDAFIMDGHNLATGAVACVKAIANPVSLARRVMEDTPHCLLADEGALKFAKKIGFPVLDNPLELATKESIERFREPNWLGIAEKYVDAAAVEKKEAVTGQGFDTVGAVALDSNGRLASATSTGGLDMKMLGRVGDSPLVGCGGYANTTAATSTTGHGESIMKMVLAWDVVRNVEDGMNPMQACSKSVNKMVSSIAGVGGVIALNHNGEFGRAFSSKHMPWASISGQVIKFGLERGEEQEVPL